MEIEDIIVQEFNLNIKVVEINNKKLTKSLFDQLPEKFPFSSNGEFIGDKIFVFIKIKSGKQTNDFLLFVKENKVYKSDLSFLKNLSKLSLNSKYHDNQFFTDFIFFRKQLEDFINGNHLENDTFKEFYSMNYRTVEIFNENGKNLIEEAKKKCFKILKSNKRFTNLHLKNCCTTTNSQRVAVQ